MKRRGALIHGHFHTHFYVQEHLAEIYQKQQTDGVTEEEKINQFLMRGLKLGIVSGSDTHDNRPANPIRSLDRPVPGTDGCMGGAAGPPHTIRCALQPALLRHHRRAHHRGLSRER